VLDKVLEHDNLTIQHTGNIKNVKTFKIPYNLFHQFNVHLVKQAVGDFKCFYIFSITSAKPCSLDFIFL